jgi:hypothetical protein
MRVISALAIACAIALPAHAQLQQQIAAPTLFSLRGGETLRLRTLGWITSECVSTFSSLEGIDVLEGPPEVTLKFEPGSSVSASSASLTNSHSATPSASSISAVRRRGHLDEYHFALAVDVAHLN